MAKLPCGIRSFEYHEDMAIIRTGSQWFLAAVFLGSLFFVPLMLSEYWLTVIVLMGITMIAVIGLNVLTGYAGQISLGQSAFLGVGAYTAGILATKTGVPFLIALPVSGLVGALIGIFFGLPSLRVKGFYLAMATLAAQFILIFVFGNADSLTEGDRGILVPPANIGSFEFDTTGRFYYLMLVVLIVMAFLARNLIRTKAGRAFVAIRDNDRAASIMGVNLFRYKLLAFAICSFYAGVAGCLYAHFVERINPDQYTLHESIWMVGMIIVGGTGSILGAIVGTFSLVMLDEYTPTVATWLGDLIPSLTPQHTTAVGLTMQGALILGFIIYEPRGLAYRWEMFKSTYRLWPFKH